MDYRVVKPFKFCGSRGKIVKAEAGQIVNINTKVTVEKLLREQKIVQRDLQPIIGGSRIKPTSSHVAVKRIGIWMVTSVNYSGGRVHMYQYGWSLAEAGAEVFLITDRVPRWMKDYPQQKRISVLMYNRDIPPDDIDVIITDSKAGMGKAAIAYKKAHPHVPMFVMNFETPNWVAKYCPDYSGRLGLSKGKEVFKQADYLMANSRLSLEYLRKWLQDGKTPGFVMHPAVNTFALDEAAPAVRKRPYAVWTGRSPAYKKAGVAVDAIWSLKVPFDLVMFGNPTRFQINNSSGLHRMIPLKNVDDKTKFAHLKGAEVVLAPSLFEGFGMVPAEALASGTPVVAYDLPVLREEYKGIKGLHLIKWDDQARFIRKVQQIVSAPKQAVEMTKARERIGMTAMAKTIEALPYHAVKRKQITAHLIGYWGVLSEAIESVYPHVDQIIVALGRVPHARKVDDGSIRRVEEFPDPDGKIVIEKRDMWDGGKQEMREWCVQRATGNRMLLLDGDEVWVGLDKWIKSGIEFGCPRWVNFWHDGNYWIHDSSAQLGKRWGFRIPPQGSMCPHYRWSWWRPSYYFRHHPAPYDASGLPLHVRNSDAAMKVPQCAIYHLGHALPKKIMKAKHEFYRSRDGDDASRRKRQKCWHDWDHELGDVGDGIVKQVDWPLPKIVERALASIKELT